MNERSAARRCSGTHKRHARPHRTLAGLLGLLSALLGRTPAPAIAAEAPTVTANFHAIGLYWTRTQSPDGVAVQYRRTGARAWKAAQPLWWDALSLIPGYREQYRGSIVNLQAATSYDLRYSHDGGFTWSAIPSVRTRPNKITGTTIAYTGTQASKLVISEGGTSANWKIHDGQGTAVIDPNHTADCVQIKASYVVLRGFSIRDCKYNAITIENANVIIERNTIEDWGSQEIAPDNPKPRLGDFSKKPLSDPTSTCIAGTVKSDIGRYADSGVKVLTAANDGIVIQRNTIRNPRYRSTRWQECPGYGSHPYGPRAISIDATAANFGTGNVIRHNDIYATNTTEGGVKLANDANVSRT
jgi:hypothetical protein